jgi:hypothetical protein
MRVGSFVVGAAGDECVIGVFSLGSGGLRALERVEANAMRSDRVGWWAGPVVEIRFRLRDVWASLQ